MHLLGMGPNNLPPSHLRLQLQTVLKQGLGQSPFPWESGTYRTVKPDTQREKAQTALKSSIMTEQDFSACHLPTQEVGLMQVDQKHIYKMPTVFLGELRCTKMSESPVDQVPELLSH